MNPDEADFPCREAVALVTDYLEQALAPHERDIVDRHLALCEGCTTYFDQMRRTIALTGTLREEDVPAPVLEVLTAAFRELHSG